MSGLISFEGTEGAGKSTQIARLIQRLNAHGIPTQHTREPGGTKLGECLREVVLSKERDVHPLAELFLYSASRRQLVFEVIEPAIARNEWVICDRYTDSTLAYQGYGRGLSLHLLREISDYATDCLKPRCTFLLDLDPKIGLARAAKRGQMDRIESYDLSFHQRVREGFLELAAAETERFVILDALQNPDTLEAIIWKHCQFILDIPS